MVFCVQLMVIFFDNVWLSARIKSDFYERTRPHDGVCFFRKMHRRRAAAASCRIFSLLFLFFSRFSSSAGAAFESLYSYLKRSFLRLRVRPHRVAFSAYRGHFPSLLWFNWSDPNGSNPNVAVEFIMCIDSRQELYKYRRTSSSFNENFAVIRTIFVNDCKFSSNTRLGKLTY